MMDKSIPDEDRCLQEDGWGHLHKFLMCDECVLPEAKGQKCFTP